MAHYIIGSNYELADTALSSKLAFDQAKLETLHTQLISQNLADCCLIISTCNRSEVFVYKRQVENLELWTSRIRDLVLEVHQLSPEHGKYFYEKTNYQACLHLFKVACGLDSLVLGEPQITGQIKDAMNFTEKFYATHNLKIPAEFFKLLDEAFACAKEVRTKTAIGKYAVSIAYMACKIARNVLTHFNNQSILLIGASQTNLLLARHLIRNGITDIKVINRSQQNGLKFINELNLGSLHGFNELERLLSESTLIFSSTSASDFIVTKAMAQRVQEAKNYNETLFFDLAIPNDIDPQVREIRGVNLYNRDDLQTLVDINKQKRYDATKDCMPILYKYLNEYKRQNRILQGNKIIVKYRDSVHQHRQKLVEEAQQAVMRGADPLLVIESLSLSLTNKVLHTPTLMLASFIKNGQACELNTIHEFLDRSDKENIQNVVDETLSKDIFKNSCCKGDDYEGCCRNGDHEFDNDFSHSSSRTVSDYQTATKPTSQSRDYQHTDSGAQVYSFKANPSKPQNKDFEPTYSSESGENKSSNPSQANIQAAQDNHNLDSAKHSSNKQVNPSQSGKTPKYVDLSYEGLSYADLTNNDYLNSEFGEQIYPNQDLEETSFLNHEESSFADQDFNKTEVNYFSSKNQNLPTKDEAAVSLFGDLNSNPLQDNQRFSELGAETASQYQNDYFGEMTRRAQSKDLGSGATCPFAHQASKAPQIKDLSEQLPSVNYPKHQKQQPGYYPATNEFDSEYSGAAIQYFKANTETPIHRNPRIKDLSSSYSGDYGSAFDSFSNYQQLTEQLQAPGTNQGYFGNRVDEGAYEQNDLEILRNIHQQAVVSNPRIQDGDPDYFLENDANLSKCPFHQAQVLDSENPCNQQTDRLLAKYKATNPKITLSSLQEVTGIFVPLEIDENENKVLNEIEMIVSSDNFASHNPDFVIETQTNNSSKSSLNDGLGIVRFIRNK